MVEKRSPEGIRKKKEYNKRYAKENYKRVSLLLNHDQYNDVKEASTANGESMNGFIKVAINERIERWLEKEQLVEQ